MPFQDTDLREFIDALKIGICRTTFGYSAELVFVNAAFAQMLGFKKAELIGLKLADIFEDNKVFRALIGRLKRQEPVDGMEVILKRKREGRVWTSISITSEDDPQGRTLHLNFVVEDITRQKEFEKDLVQSRELFKVVFDNTAAAITVTDQEEKIVAWNPFAEQMLELGREDLFNKPVHELYPEREWRKMRKLNIREKGVLSGIVTQVFKKDGTLLDVDASISILKDSMGKVVGSIGILRDISKQKRIQEMLVQAKLAAEEANSSKSIFLAKMSHELRTPMNAVLGMLDLTLDTQLTDEQRDNLKVAKEAAGNLLGLLNDILDLSKAEAGKISIESIEISLREIVRNVCKGLQVLTVNKSIQLVYSVADDVPPLVMGDPVRIRQIIINLVTNAIKFTHKGKVEIGLKALSRKNKDCEFLFSIKDSGIGIPQDRIGSLFELFTQVDEKTSRRYGGTGLGLAISKKLVEMMGGRIWAESEEGQGSTFNFLVTLPVSDNVPPPAAVEGAPVAGVAPDGIGKIRILLAEDNLVNQKIAARILEKRGWEVVVANNGREAVDMLGKGHYDIILMDDHMPEMTGVEATILIRGEEKQTGIHIPIVAMTANAMTGDREKYLATGMDGYVSKPIDRDALFRMIINLVQQRKGA
ncbi:MAG: PAS domain S-box protein [Candidatus Omnitrophica bacterium]|nr:PAS domain S-box protein [Candidatus Omnitrophota bacterium]